MSILTVQKELNNISQRYYSDRYREFGYDKLIPLGHLGDLQEMSIAGGGAIIPGYNGDNGSGAGDWTERGLNYFGTGGGVGRSGQLQQMFKDDDDLIDNLHQKNIRIVAYYTGSFDCEATVTGSTLFNKGNGFNATGDMQITNVLHEKIQGGNRVASNSPEWTQVTTLSNLAARASGETYLEAYKNQSWSNINEGGYPTSSWNIGEFNYDPQEWGSPFTSLTGQLKTPLRYSDYISAYVAQTGQRKEMWVRTDMFEFNRYTSSPTDSNHDRLIASIGSHGSACGTILLFIYVEPIGSSLPNPTDTVPPNNPDLVSANIENDEVTLTWEPSSSSDLSTYNIYYRYKGVSGSLFGLYNYIGTGSNGSRKATYSLNDSTYGLTERYGEFQFKIQPVDYSYNVNTGTEFPVKGQFEAISFVKSGTQIVSSGGQTLSITGIQANDLIMLSGTSDNQTVDAPTGFTQLEDDDGTANPGAVVCYKIASGTSESITLTNQGGSGANQIIWGYQVFRNVSTSNPVDTSASNHNAGSNRINLPSVTTTTDNCMIVVYGMIDDDGYSSLALPFGYTRTIMDYTGIGFNGNYSTVVGGYKLEGNAGTYSPGAIFLAQADGRDGFTIALRPKQEDFKTTLPEFSYIYWEATQSTSTSFYVYCEFDITNSDIPTSAKAYVTVDGTTPSTTNFVEEAVLVDTTTGSTAATWDSSTQLGFNTSGVSINDEVKVLIVANNSKGDENSVVVTLTIATLGNNNTEYIYP